MSDSHVRFSGHGRPALVAAAHGTRSEIGTATIRTLLSGLRSALPDVQAVEAWVDVRQPDIPAALASIEGPVVLVPLLLSVGYHVDIPLAVAGRAQTIVAPALGPDPWPPERWPSDCAKLAAEPLPASRARPCWWRLDPPTGTH